VSDVKGIDDTSEGQCAAALNIKGEHFRCDLALDHNGWAHSSRGAEAIWSPATGLPAAAGAS